MTLNDVVRLLDATVLWAEDELLEQTVENACGSDLMSDVLAYVKNQSLLLTGLVNPQVVRTAEMMDFLCIVFVRGKLPSPEMIELAKARSIVMLSTTHRMFTACGALYSAGLKGGALV